MSATARFRGSRCDHATSRITSGVTLVKWPLPVSIAGRDDMNFQMLKTQSDRFFSQAAAQKVSETTPASISDDTVEFCKEIGSGSPVFVPVQSDRYGLYGYCSDGVNEKIKHDGGAIRFGWAIWEYPRLYLTAEFHAVWVNGDGNAIDITPKPSGETRIVFSGNGSYSSIFDFNQRPANRLRQIYKPASRIEVVRARVSVLIKSSENMRRSALPKMV